MRLTMHTDLALRTLMYLGLRPGTLAAIPEIAAAYRVSEHHLTKVANGLARHGFVEALRGRGGGLRLVRPAAEIGIGEVVRRMEEDLALLVCFDQAGQASSGGCAIAGICGLQSLLGEALAAFLAVLDRTTLADLLRAPTAGAMAARLGRPLEAPQPTRHQEH